jgi:DoxX-like protein
MRFNRTLWVIQGLLAALFLFAGGMKLMMPIETMQQGPVVFPGAFLRFIGVVEVLGALGLILPGLFRIRTGLTSLAAAGLVVIMVGATAITAATGPVSQAIVPFVTGVLAILVARGRWRLVHNVVPRRFDRTLAAS